MTNIDILKGRVHDLSLLLNDPHPGLMTWRDAYAEFSNRLIEFFGHGPDCGNVAAERGRCANVAKNWEPTKSDPGVVCDGVLDIAASIANAIRNPAPVAPTKG
jgi:hypothetical protein